MSDPLTNLALQEELETKLASVSHPKLILLDIDKFSDINFKYSDKVGDAILCFFADSLKEFAKKSDLEAFRLRGDIFALVADMPFELKRVENLLFSVSDFCSQQTFPFKESEIELKFHMGLCLDQNNLIKKALKALELSKRENQPFVTYAEFVLNLLDEDESSTKKLIQIAIDEEEIFPYYQQVLRRDKTPLYKEMLLRMEIGNTIQSPKFFLYVAQKNGLYEDILDMVFQQLPKEKNTLGINVSKSDLFDEAIFTRLLEFFKGSSAVFEIQTFGAKEPHLLAEKIQEIKNAGIRVCLENIQNREDLTPYMDLEVDFVKVFGQSIRLLRISQEEQQKCRELLECIKNMGAKSIASHINSQATFEKAQDLGFDYFQGFYLAKPSQ